MDRFNYFVPLSKVTKNEDGSRTVVGYASTPTKDIDGEVVTLGAVKKAVPGYMQWRNIRQMHQDIAVGVTKEAHVDDTGLYITGKIVDENAVKLIDAEVLKGFSIGGKKLKKVGNEIREIDLIEISLVDRPANPDCRFDVQKSAKDAVIYTEDKEPASEDEVSWLRKTVTALLSGARPSPASADESDYGDGEYETLCKRKFSSKEREDAAGKGEALPDGSFPIKNKQDLKNAIQAHGRAKDKEAAKKHIISRAKALGATDELPKDWESGKTEKSAMSEVFKSKSQNDFGWEDFGTLAKVAPNMLSDLPSESTERLAKGLGTISDLGYAFSSIRNCQRRLMAEGAIEKDGDDEALARRLGQVASELALVISEKAQHEASEAVFLTDVDDIQSYLLITEGPNAMSLTASTGDLAKRASKAVRGQMGKASDHVKKAKDCQTAGMKMMGKAAKLLTDHLGKAAGSKDVMDALKGAFDQFVNSADQLDLAKAAMAKAASADVCEGGPAGAGAAPGTVSPIGQGEMTEGEVPLYSAIEDYFASARGDGALSSLEEAAETLSAGSGGSISRAEADALVKAAAAEARAAVLAESNQGLQALLAKTPAGLRKGAVFPAPEKGAILGTDGAVNDKNAVLLDGIDLNGLSTDTDRRKAASTMVANMISRPDLFAKSVMDPNFKGLAGNKSAS